MRVLVFSRNYLMADFQESVTPLARDNEFFYITDGVCKTAPDTRQGFYAALKSGTRHPQLTPEIEDEIIIRCRYLRNIDPEFARGLVHAFFCTFGEVLEATKPDVVLAQMTDEYVGHCLATLAGLNGIAVVQICPSYFSGKLLTMKSAYGEPLVASVPSDADVENTISKISDAFFRQDYAVSAKYSFRKHLYRMFRHYAKRVIFAARGVIQRDPLHLHHVILPYLADQTRVSDYPGPGTFHSNWKGRIQELRASGIETLVYVPLAYHPEGTIDYWIADQGYIDYCEATLDMVRKIASDPKMGVVVKEHTHVIGTRDIEFYKRLKDIPNVVSVAFDEFSNEVLKAIDCVLIGAGSVGIEATVHGIPVVAYCNTSFWFAPSGAKYVNVLESDDLPAQIRQAIDEFEPASEAEKCERVRGMMASTINVLKPGRVWPVADPSDLTRLLNTARALPVRETQLHKAIDSRSS